MSATYDELLPTDRDRARALLGDTDVPDNALLTDAHIDAVLTLLGTFEAGVAFLADSLVAQIAQEPDSVKLPSGLAVSWKERIDAWTALAARMRGALADVAQAESRTAVGINLRGYPRPDYTVGMGNEVDDATPAE